MIDVYFEGTRVSVRIMLLVMRLYDVLLHIRKFEFQDFFQVGCEGWSVLPLAGSTWC